MPATQIATYAAFLQFLLTLGPKLQTIWPKVQAFINALTDLITAGKELIPAAGVPASSTPAGTPAGTLSEVYLTADVLALESQVAGALGSPTAAFNVEGLRQVWQKFQAVSQHATQFAEQHPALISILLSLFKVA